MKTLHIRRAQKQAIAQKPLSKVIASLEAHYLELDRNAYAQKMEEKHRELYPPYREMNNEEKAEHSSNYLQVHTDISVLPDDYEYSDVKIDYLEDERYLSFEAYLSETETVVVNQKSITSDDGVESFVDVLEEKLVRPFIEKESYENEAKTDALYVEYKKASSKNIRAKKVEELTVAIHTIEYDANETAQDRMNRILGVANFKAIQAICEAIPELAPIYEAVYKQSIPWKGADNQFHNVQVESIAEATEASLIKLADVWVDHG